MTVHICSFYLMFGSAASWDLFERIQILIAPECSELLCIFVCHFAAGSQATSRSLYFNCLSPLQPSCWFSLQMPKSGQLQRTMCNGELEC